MKKAIRFLFFVLIAFFICSRTGFLSHIPFISQLTAVSEDSESYSDSAAGGTDPDTGIGSLVSDVQDLISKDSEPDTSEFPDHYCYYYQQLSGEEQEVYLEIYAALRDRVAEQTLSTKDPDLMTHVFTMVQYDHPEFIWVDSCQYVVTSGLDNAIKKITLTPDYSMTDEEIRSAQSDISAWYASFVSYLNEKYPDADDWEKAMAAFRWIIANTEYQTGAPHNQDMYSTVLGETVCQGYATAFEYLCNQMDVPCLIVTGTAETGGSHAWNMVYVNGSWCNVDCTYGDSPILDFDKDYSWFGVSSDLISSERTCTDADLLPEGDHGENSYFYKKGCFQESYDLNRLVSMAASFHPLGVTYASQEAYEQACKNLFDKKEVQYLGDGNSFSYVTEDLSLTIFIQISE